MSRRKFKYKFKIYSAPKLYMQAKERAQCVLINAAFPTGKHSALTDIVMILTNLKQPLACIHTWSPFYCPMLLKAASTLHCRKAIEHQLDIIQSFNKE